MAVSVPATTDATCAFCAAQLKLNDSPTNRILLPSGMVSEYAAHARGTRCAAVDDGSEMLSYHARPAAVAPHSAGIVQLA